MKPLREQAGSDDPVVARAAELLSRLGPTPESPARMRRIRRMLDRSEKRFSLPLLRPVAVFGLATGLVATAGAAYGVARIVSSVTESKHDLKTASPPMAATATGPKTPTRRVVDVPETPLPETDELATPEAVAVETPAEGERSDRVDDNPQHRRRTRSSEPKRPSASEAKVVQQGLEALRKHKDPEKAAEHLDAYRKKHPNGTLAEEALALSVEAAAASGDPRAKKLAVQYLSRYPQGRFKDAARRALAKALAEEKQMDRSE